MSSKKNNSTKKANLIDQELKLNISNEVKSQSFAEEIENDKNKIQTYLTRFKGAIKEYGIEHEVYKQEKLSADVFKRVLIMTGANEIYVIGDNKTQLASENNLPVSSYLVHGGRIKIEIPVDSDESLINWITSGNKEIDGKSRHQDQRKALDENKVVYNRSAATHDVIRKKMKKMVNMN